MSGRRYYYFALLAVALATGGCATMDPTKPAAWREFAACGVYSANLGVRFLTIMTGIRPFAQKRTERFLGKVKDYTARCRGGENAVEFRDGEKTVASRDLPWVDWQNYWATGDKNSKAGDSDWLLSPNRRGIRGALFDLEYQRMELIKFNLFDNSGTYEEYVLSRKKEAGLALRVWNAIVARPALWMWNAINEYVLGRKKVTGRMWNAMRLRKDDPNDTKDYAKVGGDGPQLCQGDLIRFRNLRGICNDIRNPLMGSTDQPFARNVEFETTFPDLGKNELVRNRHSDRLGLLKPDPQVISRKLFTRNQEHPDKCNAGLGLEGYTPDANCDYKKAPFFNVLAAFWIQFMTHDWFSHLKDGHNQEKTKGEPDLMAVGCKTQRVNNVEMDLTRDDVERLGCRPDDRMDRAYLIEAGETFLDNNKKPRLARAYNTTENTVTAWWDASQIYGYDVDSKKRVKRELIPDPLDPTKTKLGAKLRLEEGYLPPFEDGDPINPAWSGQEATAFPDNWSIGLSFFHNVFAREHNKFVDEFRIRQKEMPESSGLRNPTNPDKDILYKDVSDDELFEIARLVVSAEIAKIHTIEWTTQLLYNEPLFLGMNANWHGLDQNHPAVGALADTLADVVSELGKSDDPEANQWYSVLAAGPGIFGLGSQNDKWSLKNPNHVNGGINHFGSPFNFPEEFVTVYRLHPMIPDLLEYRELNHPDKIPPKIPVVETFRDKATKAMHDGGLANWALSMGRQRLGKLTLQNHPQFLQNLPMRRLQEATGKSDPKIDVAALDLIRDRERGVPRFNEFRRQYGLKTLTSFDDFVDQRLKKDSPERKEQERLVELLREVYGQHECDRKKIITTAQVNDDGKPINDCLGHEKGIPLDEKILVDNIEDLDTVVGWLAEPVRPHGFAISETQFQVFILNASRRLFSDRFFTSSFRPEFYTILGVDWVNKNGIVTDKNEQSTWCSEKEEVSPLKCVLLRTIPELRPELEHVVNVFDPWARDRGEYYSLEWKARPGAGSDPAFSPTPAQ